MSIVTLATFKDYARNEIASADDVVLQACIDSGSALVNDYCARNFVLASAASDRHYSPTRAGQSVLRIHDCVTVNTVTVMSSALAATTYQAEPLDAITMSGDPRPTEQLRSFYYPWLYDYGRAWIVVNATWGWPGSTLPTQVTEAALITARDIYINRNAPVDLSDMAKMLLNPYRRAEAFGLG